MRLITTLFMLLSTTLTMAQEDSLEKVELKVGDSDSAMDMQFSFKQVLMDSRCPSDAQCVMAGWADVEVGLIVNEGEEQIVKIRVDASEQHLIHPTVLERENGLRVMVGKLTPYPLSTQKFEDREYCVELWIYQDQ